jgi:hypothetical protein
MQQTTCARRRRAGEWTQVRVLPMRAPLRSSLGLGLTGVMFPGCCARAAFLRAGCPTGGAHLLEPAERALPPSSAEDEAVPLSGFYGGMTG